MLSNDEASVLLAWTQSSFNDSPQVRLHFAPGSIQELYLRKCLSSENARTITLYQCKV